MRHLHLILSYFSVVLGEQLFQDSTPLKHLAEIDDAALNDQALQHRLRVAKCQMTDESTPVPESIAICTSQINDVVCSTGLLIAIIEVI